MAGPIRSTPSSGNVFADRGLPDADELLPKSELAWRIAERIRERGLTRAQATAELGIDQPRASDLVNGRLRRFSLDRLLQLANAAGLDVTITVGAAAAPTGRGRTVGGGGRGPVAATADPADHVRFA